MAGIDCLPSGQIVFATLFHKKKNFWFTPATLIYCNSNQNLWQKPKIKKCQFQKVSIKLYFFPLLLSETELLKYLTTKTQKDSWEILFFKAKSVKELTDQSPDGKQLAPSMNTRNTRCSTSTLPAKYVN